MITLKMTCSACPEQYDAVDENGKIVGYLRLRHGNFTVECPDVGGVLVYEALPDGDGCFFDHERDYYLRWAVASIEKWIKDPTTASREKPPAPEVEYKIENGDDRWST